MSNTNKMFLWVMGFMTIVGGAIWCLALADRLINHNPTTTGPLVGIPLGLVIWSPAVYLVCRFFQRGT